MPPSYPHVPTEEAFADLLGPPPLEWKEATRMPPTQVRATTPTRWTAADLLATEFPDPRWAVPGFVAEGLNIVVSPPKVGKSWLALNLAVAVAAGGRALGKVKVDRGAVLYLALEDTPRRLQRRLTCVLEGEAPPSDLTFDVQCKPLPEGGTDDIRAWLTDHPSARLVIVDVLAKVRGASNARNNAYESDYEAMSYLKELADEFQVAFLVVHHTRKMASSDFLESVSGTNGIAGAADTIIHLSRARGEADAILSVTGRDVEEDEHALEFRSDTGTWVLLDGPASDYKLQDTRRQILQAVRAQQGAKAKPLAEKLGLNHELVRKTLARMAKDGQLVTDGSGTYTPPSSVPAVPAVPAEEVG
jgi:hypothetical protein